jgi:hypothetical protein
MRRICALLSILLAAATMHAASIYPPSLHWRTITTEHFYIHYHQGEEDLASRAAAYAENAYTRLVPMMGWQPAGRTDVILADHVDLPNGSATPFPSNRVEILVTAPGADPSSPGGNYDNWLNLVITHEFTHILHIDQARGFARGMRMVFGRGPLLFSFPNLFSPLWFIEGIATVSESENTNAGRLKGTYVDMVLRTAAVEDRWASEAQASGLGPYWPTGSTRYYYGSKFLSWLATTRGVDKLRDFMNNYSGNVVPFRVNASAKDVYGVSMKELWQQWSAEQQRTYLAERDKLAADGLTTHERLTHQGYETLNPILSPDGTRLAYAHQGPFERATIRVRDVSANRDIATHAVNIGSPLSWRADGRAIAYSDEEFVGSFSILSDLYVWDLDRGTRRITHGARLKDPAFTPDGRKLIAVENRAGRNRLVEADIESGAIQPIVTPEDDRQFDAPAVSHDGNRIAVAEWHDGTVDVVLYSRRGERIEDLTRGFTRAINASPRFSPDDRSIWFSSDITGVPNLYSVPVGGGEPQRLTNVYGGALYPTSNDGRRFFYSDYSSDGFDLARIDVTRSYPIVPRTVPATVVGNASRAAVSIPSVPAQTDANATDYSPWQSLRPRWWVPLLDTTTLSGEDKPIVGIATSGSDAIGRHSYDATISNRLYGIVYAYDRFYPTLTLAASQFHDNFILSSGREQTSVTDRVIGQISVPYRKLQWQTAGSIGVIRDHIGGDVPAGLFRGTLQGIRAGAFFNNAREYPFSISPEHGVTAKLVYENLSRSLGSDRSLQTMRGDVRGYITIPYASAPLGRHVLALRAAGGRNSGQFLLQRELKVGGDAFGELTTLDIRNFPVRGFDEGTLRGGSATIGSIEYRFPIFEIDRGPTTWPIFFNRVHGDVFTDAGRAGGRHIASAGAEGTFDFTLGNFLLIQYRAGVAIRLAEPENHKVVPYISLGTSF